MDLNKVQIIGNVTQDIELKQTPNGQYVASFSIATNRKWTNKETWEIHEESEFHNVVLWWKLAEIANQYCKKWNKIYFEGRNRTRSWEWDDGKKRYRTEIIWENIILLWWGKWKKDDFSESDKKHGVGNDEITKEDIPF